MQVKVSDYIFEYLHSRYGVEVVFLITGGGAMHLNDALAKNPHLRHVCCHHEQACAIAAEGYARTSQKLGVVNVTTGPGGLNTLTGVMGQYTDSVPVLYVSGQVKQATTISACPEIPLRQLGDQEVDIVSVVKPLTKYARQITRAEEVKRILDEAVYFAMEGRPGPVWIDVPMDIQGAMVEEEKLEESPMDLTLRRKEPLPKDVEELKALIAHSERVVLIGGHGIRLSGGMDAFRKLLEKHPVPVVSTFNGFDILPEDHPCYVGRIGTLGTRAGNFVLQNADLVISIGSRNNIRQISYNYETFARGGKLVVVDVDGAELEKPTLRPYLTIEADARAFIQSLESLLEGRDFSAWLAWGKQRQQRYPNVLESYSLPENPVHPYYFLDRLSLALSKPSVVVAGNGTACVAAFQACKVQEEQRYFWNSGCAAMGYDLPAAIGAAMASEKGRVLCIAGDGSLMMNLQEMATLQQIQKGIKLIVLNNKGYISIRQTQNNFFAGCRIGSSLDSGLFFPDFLKVAEAFGLQTMRIEKNGEVEQKIRDLLSTDENVVCEVMLQEDYIFQPKTSSFRRSDGSMVSKPLEDLFPFLDRKEFLENMIIEPIKE